MNWIKIFQKLVKNLLNNFIMIQDIVINEDINYYIILFILFFLHKVF